MKPVLFLSIAAGLLLGTSSPAATCSATFASCPQATEYAVFIDMNLAASEANCASAANCKAGKQTILIPTESEKAEIKAALKKASEDAAGNAPAPPGPGGTPPGANTTAADQKVREVIKRAFSQLKGDPNAAKNITSVIFSGHDGGGRYGGEMGSFRVEELETLIPKERRDAITSFRAWGCYTAVLQQTKNRVLPLFKNLEYMGGFYQKGYLSSDARSGDFLYESISTEEKLRDAKSVSELNKAIASVSFLTNPSETHPSAVWVRGSKMTKDCDSEGYYYTQAGLRKDKGPEAETLRRIFARCPDNLQILRGEKTDPENPKALNKTTYKSILNGDVDLPPSSDSKSSLRLFYGKLRSSEHCLDDPRDSDNQNPKTADIPNPDDVLMVLFNREVFGNFLRHASTELSSFQTAVADALKKIQACRSNSPDCKASDAQKAKMARLSLNLADYIPVANDAKSGANPTFRKKVNERAYAIDSLFEAISPARDPATTAGPPGAPPSAPQAGAEPKKDVPVQMAVDRNTLMAIADFKRLYSSIVVEPVANCIPLGWVDANSNETSTCQNAGKSLSGHP
jgi:hypothetical protein